MMIFEERYKEHFLTAYKEYEIYVFNYFKNVQNNDNV